MHLEPYGELNWAYQLHYYLCFQTHYKQKRELEFLSGSLSEICQQHGYHLLKFKFYPDHVRCLVSLRPFQAISDVMQKIKGNLSKVACSTLNTIPPLWARGYLARTVGKRSAQAVKRYLEIQSEHHNYSGRIRPPVFRYRARYPKPLQSSHTYFELSYHMVFATAARKGIFDSSIGSGLNDYWLRVADKHAFAIDQLSALPDHIHMVVRIVPKMSIEKCALLLNNGQYYVGKHFPAALIDARVNRLWQPSAYSGSFGNVTTALVKSFLSMES